MKRATFVVIAFASLPSAALAQSSLNLFGAVDLAARYTHGGAGPMRSLSPDGYTASKLGFRGVEDLGGGLYAGFHLEAALKPDVGGVDSARFFGRRATLSLIDPLGELRLGRDHVPSYWNNFDFDPFRTYGVASAENLTEAAAALLGSGINTIERADNTIAYFLPSHLGGVYGQAMVAAGEGMSGRRYRGARIGWKSGPVDAAIGFGTTATATGGDFRQKNVGGAWDFGPAKLMGFYDVHDYAGSRQKTWLVGTTATFGSSTLRASYESSQRSGGTAGSGYVDGDDSQQIGVGYVYELSKATHVYATVARILNHGGARVVVTGDMPPTAMRAGDSSSGAELGVAHTF